MIEFRDSLRLKDELPFRFSCYNHSDRIKIVHKLSDCPSCRWKATWLQTKNSIIIVIKYRLLTSLPHQINTTVTVAKNFSGYEYAVCKNVGRSAPQISMTFLTRGGGGLSFYEHTHVYTLFQDWYCIALVYTQLAAGE